MNEVTKVTKIKHPGRVVSGKRLVEWNRKNKKDLLQEAGQEPKQEPKPELEQELSTETSLKYVIGGAIVLAIGIVVFFYWNNSKLPKTASQPAAEPKNDIFRMN